MTKAESCEVLLSALQANFPTSRPVYIQWMPRLRYYDRQDKKWLDYFADCGRVGKRMRIRLSKKLCREKRAAHDTLLHEYAHAVLWGSTAWERHPVNQDSDLDHPPAFWAQYGQQYEWFFHQGVRRLLGIS